MFERVFDLLVYDSPNTWPREAEFSIRQEIEGDVGCVVWDAAIVMIKYLETLGKKIATFRASGNLDHTSNASIASMLLLKQLLKKCIPGQRTNVLELGAGTGACSLAFACLFPSKCCVTDLKDFIPSIQSNIDRNTHCFITQSDMCALELNWCDKKQIDGFERFDLILLSDCVYYEESMSFLVQTLKLYCGPKTLILMSIEDRTSKVKLVESFWKLMDDHFACHEIALEDQDVTFRCDEIHLYVIVRSDQLSNNVT